MGLGAAVVVVVIGVSRRTPVYIGEIIISFLFGMQAAI